MSPSLDIVIVEFRSDLLRECLASIRDAEKSDLSLQRVVVVDNSGAGSPPVPAEGLPLEVILNDSNRGFAAGCNQGAAGSTAGYLLFLNPDVRLSAEALVASVAFMELPSAAHVGICGVRNLGNGDTISISRFPSAFSMMGSVTGLSSLLPGLFRSTVLDPGGDRREVDQVNGAYFLVRRQVFEALGGFDERFFLYFEEVDFSLRARQQGYASYYLPDLTVIHKGGVSGSAEPALALGHFLRSRLIYCSKHLHVWAAAPVVLLSLIVEPVVRVGRALGGRGKYRPRQVMGAYRHLLSWRK